MEKVSRNLLSSNVVTKAMKKIIILIILLTQFNLYIEAQSSSSIKIIHYPDTMEEFDSLNFVAASAVLDTEEPFVGCSPLIRYRDSLQMNYLVYDLVFDL